MQLPSCVKPQWSHDLFQFVSGMQAAIRHIRNLAQENHERALPELQKSSFALCQTRRRVTFRL